MLPTDIESRLEALQQSNPNVRLFALVDGLHWQSYHGSPLEPVPDSIASLFEETEEEALAPAGPWLLDAATHDDEDHEDEQISILFTLEHYKPCVSWLFTELDLPSLTEHLRQKLNIKLPNNKTGLLRFYDPRVLFNLAHALEPLQRTSFFEGITEWHFLHNGERMHIGSHA